MNDAERSAAHEPPRTIAWTDDGAGLVILDQTQLPGQRVERELRTVEEIAEAITSLRVRGAPLIGVTAAMGVAALAEGSAREDPDASAAELRERVEGWCRLLEATRPTAVNLSWALDRMRAAARDGGGSASGLARELREEARSVRDEDRETCRRIGEHAVSLLADGASAVTHCNAGALATSGIGTALAPVYVAHRRGWRLKVFADETRPLLQGSRLTAWELSQAGVDVTVIADGMAGALMSSQEPDVVLVGADRVAANGDVANKVGTYPLAVLARRHGVPFYVLAPTSTVDLDVPSGEEIPIEFRDRDEIGRAFGRVTMPADAEAWTPAFDVTPADLIDGIVTEEGICRAPYGPALERAVAAAARRRGG